ncbi:MAG: tRNA (adenosine(37)-N6)-dimethylallyltransferase MiaA, partial [Acidobacteriota bacterium]
MRGKCIIIMGPTGVGKSALALFLAPRLGGEIISADAIQVYKGLQIGTAKPSSQELAAVRHYLIDVMEPDQRFSAGQFMKLALRAIREIRGRNKVPIIVGGTGLYIKALLKGLFQLSPRDMVLRKRMEKRCDKKGLPYMHRMLKRIDPESYGRIGENDRQRILRALEIYFTTKKTMSQHLKENPFAENKLPAIKIGLILPRAELYKRINERVEKMLASGWIEEVEDLLQRGYSPQCHAFKALGYREIIGFLNGEYSIERLKELIQQNTRRYAKRQLTWLRKEEGLNWFSLGKNPKE